MTETVQQKIQSLEQHLSSKPRSPLFAQLAAYYLDANRSRDALDLCDKGLSHYPFYSTGHLIKGKVLLALKMTAEARREFEFVRDLFSGLDALEQVLRDLPSNEIETLAAPATPVDAPVAQAITTEPPETFWQTPETSQEASTEIPVESEDVFGFATQLEVAAETEPAISEETAVFEKSAPEDQIGESFQEFAERKRGELFGLQNSTPLEEYLSENRVPETMTDVMFKTAKPDAAEDPFSALSQQPTEESVETPLELSTEDPFATLNQQPTEESVETLFKLPTEDPFATLNQQPTEESFETPPEQTSQDPFAQLQPGYFEPGAEESAFQDEAARKKGQIEELADKLQNAKKITPIIDLSDKTSSSDSETSSGTGFVTPTLAEIYAKQGWYDDAIKAYKTLALSKPAEKEKFESRIQELKEMKRKQDSG
jgi:tetratricopeptide (TPR) repeat protein